MWLDENTKLNLDNLMSALTLVNTPLNYLSNVSAASENKSLSNAGLVSNMGQSSLGMVNVMC